MTQGPFPRRHHSRAKALRSWAVATFLLFGGGAALGQEKEKEPIPALPEAKVTAPRPEPEPTPSPEPPARSPLIDSGRTVPITNAIGGNIAASQGIITQADLANKPMFRTTDFLERIPGLIITSETAGIDANTMFIRGFLIDHGTDFAFFIDGVPINLGSNVHAQGYTDLQSVIPELVSTIDFGKGPYFAKVGNFSAVGYANIQYFDELPYGFAKVEAGKWDWFRTVVADSGQVGPGVLLFGVQFNYFNNCYEVPEHLNKTTAMFRYTIADDTDRLTLSTILYNGQGTAEPITPLSLVHQGVDRFVNLSPSDFIVANRFTANAQYQHTWSNDSVTQGNLYGYWFSLNLIENPNGFLNDPVNGDQISQIDRRWVTGFNLAHTWKTSDRSSNTLGVQLRHDDIPESEIFATSERRILATNASYSTRTTDTGLFYENQFKWSEKVRTVLGLRSDIYSASVEDHLLAVNSGSKTTPIILPKGSLIMGPWDKTNFYLTGGYSFHSNAAPGAVASVDAASNPINPTPLLVQRGAEVGISSQAIDYLTTSIALWQLHLGSELVFDPSDSTTVPLRSSDRYGIEWINTYQINDWLQIDSDYCWSHGRLLGIDPATPGQHIPQAPTTIFVIGPSVTLPIGLFANLRYRYWGPRYLNEDGSASSRATNLWELSTGYQCPSYTFNLQILNLFNSKGHDIDFFDEANWGQPTNPDILFKPLAPFAARASFTLRW